MTLDQIADGLAELALRLADTSSTLPLNVRPASLTTEEWVYIRGVASGEILRLSDRLREVNPR